jgi:hypothetical protein
MKYRFQWNFPILFSKHETNKLYAFSNNVHVTTDEGQSWETISPDLTRNDPTKLVSSGGPITQDNTSVEYYCTIFAAAESPINPGELWVGSDDGLVHISKDGGASWNNITPKKLPEWAQINSIEPSRYDPATCYIAATRYKLGDFKPYLLKTTDYGESWEFINEGIPAEHFTRVIREDDKNPNILYAGTETGLYLSVDAGDSWKSFQMNLPIVPVTDLAVKNNNLIIATQGRSLWIHDDLDLVRQSFNVPVSKQKSRSSKVSMGQAHLFKPKNAYRMSGSGRSGSLTAGENHPAGVQVHFYIPEEVATDSISLSFYDNEQQLIRSFSTTDRKNKLSVKNGANRFNWDTVYEGAEKLPGMILWWSNLSGPKAVPGTYTVELQVSGKKYTQEFQILTTPQSESSIEDMKKQFEFVNQVNETVNKAHESIKTIRSFTKKLDAFKELYTDHESEEVQKMVVLAKEMKTKFSAVEKALYQTQNKSGQDPLNFPIRLTNKLAHLNSLAQIGDFAPTDQSIAVKDELTAAIEKELKVFNNVLDTDIKKFNTMFNELKLDYLMIQKE